MTRRVTFLFFRSVARPSRGGVGQGAERRVRRDGSQKDPIASPLTHKRENRIAAAIAAARGGRQGEERTAQWHEARRGGGGAQPPRGLSGNGGADNVPYSIVKGGYSEDVGIGRLGEVS